MRVTSLTLRNFRNYEALTLTPGEGMTVFSGPNAQGKTNLLEALHLCMTGRSHRTARDEEIVRWGEEAAFVSVRSVQRDGTHEVSVSIARDKKKKKAVRVGARPAERIGELFGHVFGVLFSPEDLMLVKGGPGERRRFLDMQLSQLRPAYFYALQRAQRALMQRNALLREIPLHPELMDTLPLWDEQLSRAGASVVRGRKEMVDYLSEAAAGEHLRLTGGRETLSLRYHGEAAFHEDAEAFLLSRLQETREEDIRRQTTTTGFHRDDMGIFIDGRDARLFASQGQQRTAVLALKLAQTVFAEKERGEPPIFLLDDVMSELDPERRRQLAERIDRLQTFVTCTDISDLAGARQGVVYAVKGGRLEQANG